MTRSLISLSPRLLLPLLLLAVIAVYGPHLGNGFVFDDHPQIEQNPLVRGEVPWTKALNQGVWAQREGETGVSNNYYRPLFLLVQRLVYRTDDGSPRAFHLFNLGLQLVVILLVVAALRRLEFSPTAALVAAALFALHPLTGEVVYWASCSSELLAQIGLLVALTAVLAAEGNSLVRRICWLVTATSGTLLALFSKETAVAIAPILTLEVLRHPRQERGRRLAAVLPLWLVTLGYLWLRSRMVTSGLGAFLPDGFRNLGEVGSALARYVRLFLLPYPLTPLHAFSFPPTTVEMAVGLALLAALLAAVFLLLCWRPAGVFWLGWIVLPLLLPLVPFLYSYHQVTGPVAERYMYLSLVPWAALVVLAFRKLSLIGMPIASHRAAGAVLVLVACIAGGLALFQYGKVFRNDGSYFQRGYRYNPESPFALQWLALQEMKQDRYSTALALLDQATARAPDMTSLLMNRGMVLARLGRLPEAARLFQSMLQRNAVQPGVHLRLANVLDQLGRPDEAAYHYREELKLNPGSVAAMNNFGIYLYQHRDPRGAITLWEKALHKQPSPDIEFNLGMAYRDLGQSAPEGRYLRQFLQTAGRNYATQRQLANQWLSECATAGC